MRIKMLLLVSLCACFVHPGWAAQGQDKARVEATVILPKELPDFAGRILEIRLYKYHPQIADKAADLVELVEVKDFAHRQGQETKKAVVLGADSALDPKMGYYLTVFVLDQKTRTHIGECEHSKNNLCQVLTKNHPNKVTVQVREVKKK